MRDGLYSFKMELRRFSFRYQSRRDGTTAFTLNFDNVIGRLLLRRGRSKTIGNHEPLKLVSRLGVSEKFRSELAFECFHSTTMP